MVYYKTINDKNYKGERVVEIDKEEFMMTAPEDFELSVYGHGTFSTDTHTYFTFDDRETNPCTGEPVTLEDALENLGL